ncbi:MAG TPA: OmpA family protein [Spirochaetia bacterium]|nr:OmpA family protein [Spirochaetia bacterium]
MTGRCQGTRTARVVVLSVAALFAAVGLQADVFRFGYTKGEKYRIVSQVHESVYVNGRFSHDSDILDRISVSVTDTRGDAGNHDALFQTSERAYGSQDVYEWSEEYTSQFWRDARGAYTVDPSLFMPTVRDVPLFPEGDLKPGDSWTAPGSETHDFRANFGMSAPFSFPIAVRYGYLRNEDHEGTASAVFSIDYEIFHRVTTPPTGPARRYPVRVSGESHQTFWWDLAGRRPLYDKESFDFVFTLDSGDEVEFVGTSEGRLVAAEPLDRSKTAGDIQQQLDQQKVPDVTVAPTDEGVTITLENVNFPPNSDQLLPAEQDKLRRIADILKKYPDRDIAVSGFTARAPGYTEEDYQALSEKRARAAAEYLLSQGARRADQVTVRGRGAEAPIGDNSTEEGRRRNRRVEITILEN